MKPRELYSGAAPAAMAQMGQGLAEVGANIGRITQQGYQQAGQAIGQGIQAVGQAYDDYKKMGADVKAKEKAAGIFMEYLPPEKKMAFQESIDTMNADTKASLQDKKAFWDTAFGVLGAAVGHENLMEKTRLHETSATGRTGMSEAAATTRTGMSEAGATARQKTTLESEAERERLRLLYGTATDATGMKLEQGASYAPNPNFSLSPFSSPIYR